MGNMGFHAGATVKVYIKPLNVIVLAAYTHSLPLFRIIILYDMCILALYILYMFGGRCIY